ncbi:DNA polymerase IV [Wohlfahrtiimonas larvae]|uniref:DNA polymerase IV n=1 Tax=Wohlfahrtiimonas larvae TaxID=1157986 RepID=A0ABP9N0W3_9GAMM|nr:DNA polymerase IV [Wohlfahrtiimonas larvae]
MTRKILHVDMDAFFAQVEQRDFPHYRNKPLVVGSPDARGVVAAASYEARQFGIYSAMPSSTAKKKCPHLIFTPHRFDIYRAVSQQIHTIFSRYTDLIEPLSLDEAYLDVTATTQDGQYATEIAKSIQQDIYLELHLTSSVGVSYNKFLAKLASNMHKPFGITVITHKTATKILEQLPIEKFYGIGQQTAKKMHSLGIKIGLDLKQQSREALKLYFGKSGDYYYQCVRGEDNRPVDPIQETQSVSVENTFSKDIQTIEEIQKEVDILISTLLERLAQDPFHGKGIAIKIRFANFAVMTRSKTFSTVLPYEYTFIHHCFWELFNSIPKHPIRLIGITIQNPDPYYDQQFNLPF